MFSLEADYANELIVRQQRQTGLLMLDASPARIRSACAPRSLRRLRSLWLAGCGSEPAGAASPGRPRPLQSTPADAANGKNAAATPKPKLRPGAKTVASWQRAGDRPYDKTFDDLRFEMTVGEPFQPRDADRRRSKRWPASGFAFAASFCRRRSKRGIKQFVLVRDNQECCFGPGAALYDCILVEMKPGKTAEYSDSPVAVEGTFDIREFVGGRQAPGDLSPGRGVGEVS